MKLVVQIEPEQDALVLNELSIEHFIVDQEAYCHFRDQVFFEEMESFIEKSTPGKWQKMSGLEGAEKVSVLFENEALINKSYSKYNKNRQQFYLYKNEIYSYRFLGFLNVTNEIQLFKYDLEDIVTLLNQQPKSLVKWRRFQVRSATS